jgi:hypothetical protein
MIRMDPRQLADLHWKQCSAFGRAFELKTGDSVLAMLQFPKTFGALAEASTLDETWMMNRKGFIKPEVTAHKSSGGELAASYHANLTGNRGEILLASGEKLQLRAANFWGNEWHLEAAAGEVLARFHNRGAVLASARVEVSDAARARADLGLLLTFAWYVLVLNQHDSSGA